MSTTPAVPTPQHHYLLAGEVTYQLTPDGEVHKTCLNTTSRTTDQFVTAADLARGQQAIQMLLFQQLGGPAIVSSVIFYAVSYLGLMTQEEFMSGLDQMRAQAAEATRN